KAQEHQLSPITHPPKRQYTRRARIAQSSALPPIADEPASPIRDDSQGEACPTDSGFIAVQDRATIAKFSTLPHDLAPRVTSHAAEEGKINKLKERVKILEDKEGVIGARSGDDALIKGRSMDEGEAAIERVSDDTEEMVTVLTSMDATIVLASGVVDVPTGSGSIPTTSTPAEGLVPTRSEEVPTASLVFATATVVTPVTRRKGKEVMVESETPKKKKVQKQIDAQVAREMEEQLEKEDQRRAEQIARDAEIVRIHSKEELQSWKVKDFRGMTFEAVEAKFNSVCKQMEDFIPMCSKEEAEKIKRKEVPGEKVKEMMNLVPIEEVEDLNQLWRLVKETLSTKPPTSDKEMELWVELSMLYEPDEEDQLWTHTQNFMHAPADWKLYDSCEVHHVAAKDKEIFMLVEKDYPLRKGLALVMICYKLQVENFSQI
nr:hypothetical protein [Tanacetum cinerariifolium]